MRLGVLALLVALLVPGRAAAHLGNVSYSDIEVGGNTVLWRLKYAVHLTPGLPEGQNVPPTRRALLELQDDIQRWLDDSVEVASSGKRCALNVDTLIGPDANDDIQVLALWNCADNPITALRLVFRAFETKLDDWQNIATVKFGGKIYNTVFMPSRSRLLLGDEAAAASNAEPGNRAGTDDNRAIRPAPPGSSAPSSFYTVGYRQVWTDYDHLLFFLCALLTAGSLARFASIVGSFTLAYSITLVMTALGLLPLPRAPVEIATALTIVYAAIENVQQVGAGRRVLVVFTLGLLHGVGLGFDFLDALASKGAGSDAILPSLLAFNSGVEVGLLVVVVPVAGLVLSGKGSGISAFIVRILSALLGLASLVLAIIRICAALA